MRGIFRPTVIHVLTILGSHAGHLFPKWNSSLLFDKPCLIVAELGNIHSFRLSCIADLQHSCCLSPGLNRLIQEHKQPKTIAKATGSCMSLQRHAFHLAAFKRNPKNPDCQANCNCGDQLSKSVSHGPCFNPWGHRSSTNSSQWPRLPSCIAA